jgi:putative DNA primase/helicase
MTTLNTPLSIEGLATALHLKKAGRTYLGTCPVCNYPKAFSVSSKQEKALLYCHACNATFAEFRQALALMGFSGGANPTPTPYRVGPKALKPNKSPDRTALALAIWQQTQPLEDTPAMAYLQGRGLNPPYPEALRYHGHLYHNPSQQHYPTLVALVRNDEGMPKAIQRIYLTPQGQKAPVEPCKMSLGSLAQSSVQLGPAQQTLIVSEGIETGFSVQQALGHSAWAALSTSGMQTLVLPPIVKHVILAVDHDPAGIEAANNATDRWLTQGKRVQCVLPPTPKQDFNDVLREAY